MGLSLAMPCMMNNFLGFSMCMEFVYKFQSTNHFMDLSDKDRRLSKERLIFENIFNTIVNLSDVCCYD